MAKISGFFMSTLLIVLCLWINVCHYPDAARSAPAALPSEAVPVDETRFPAAESSAEESEKTEAQHSARARGLLAVDAADLGDLETAPELLDVSASRSLDENAEPTPETPALKPASFPDEAAEIDDAPAKGLDATPPSGAKSAVRAPLRPASFDVSDVAAAPSSATVPAPTFASNDDAPRTKGLAPNDAPRTKGLRRSATKPRGAKYVRVPDVEIDAFSGSVRAADASDEEIRVVGATRAGQTERVPAPAR